MYKGAIKIKYCCALDGIDNLDFSHIAMAVEAIRTPRALYRHLLRQISILPQECREYYKHYVRQVPINTSVQYILAPSFIVKYFRRTIVTQTKLIQREYSRSLHVRKRMQNG